MEATVTSSHHGQLYAAAVFRARDGVKITYDVRGVADSVEYPYVNDLPSLKLAVGTARSYPDVYRDGSATHITRTRTELAPPGASCRCRSSITHRWRVFPNGRMELLVRYRPGKLHRQGVYDWMQTLPLPPAGSWTQRQALRSLKTEMADMAMVANRLGYKTAAYTLFNQVRKMEQPSEVPVASEAETKHLQQQAAFDGLAEFIGCLLSWLPAVAGGAITFTSSLLLAVGSTGDVADGVIVRGMIAAIFGAAILVGGIKIAPSIQAWFRASRRRTLLIGGTVVFVIVFLGQLIQAIGHAVRAALC